MTSQLENLERLRQSLEINIAKLRQSLLYWQTWQYEHEGLKEELERPYHEPSSDEMLAIGTDIGLEIVDDKEIKALLNYGKTPPRTRPQVIAQLRGRIDTGSKNASTIEKQLAAAEEKLEKVTMIAEPTSEAEGGEQLMEIHEELDEDGNVLSSHVIDASKDAKELQEMLQKNGLAEKEKEKEKPLEEQKPVAKPGSPSATSKKVTFAQETMSTEAYRAPRANNIHPTQRMLVVDDNDELVHSKPLELVHPRNFTEDEEIAYMQEARRNAQEIAPIVASFDIEEDSEYESGLDMDADMEDFDSENEYGMGDIGSELTDDYKSQMEALMRKHAVAMENAGPNYNLDVVQKLEGAHRDAGIVPKAPTSPLQTEPKKASSKGVRFAEELDISPAVDNSKQARTNSTQQTADPQAANPVSASVMEREVGNVISASRTSASRKPSKFKTNMNTLVNRSSELEDDEPIRPTVTSIPQVVSREETLPERPKKISRFKAAQMGA